MTTKAKTIDELLEEAARGELTALDMDERYREMLDECYSLESVGGPFTHMSAARVLEEVDPVAYRCGFNDWIDGELRETVEEIGGDYYDKREADELRERIEDEEADKAA